jgi:carboxyl-terminal processing protease
LYKPFKTGPAYQAGLRQDDEITNVDGQDIPTLITGLDVNEAAVKVSAKLRGSEGTSVALTIRHPDKTVQELALIRRDIVVPSVEAQRFNDGIAYLRISEFKATTTKEFDDALTDLLSTRPRGIILDLRNNPGGLLNGAQEILGRFYAGIALYEDDGAGSVKELRTSGRVAIPDVPLVVLVNGGSASASEIVAGALAERRPATTLLGEKTFGKGSVQNVHGLRDGGSARITSAHWLTPDMHAIHAIGLTPQQQVVFADEPNNLMPCVAERQPLPGATLCGDTQLAAAVHLLVAK